MSKNAVAAVLAAHVLVLTSACSGGPVDQCEEKRVTCATAGYLCDPSDGVCKCGGRGGVVCGENEVCDSAANTCVSNRCSSVDCAGKPGTSCDVRDGLCKCGGTGGTVCADQQVCNPNVPACEAAADCNQLTCPRNQTCDGSTGTCVCGAQTCSAAETCSVASSVEKVCVADNCTGVVCTGSASCDSADGLCKCNGVVCQSGQACGCPTGSDGGCADSERTCRASNLCVGVSCGGGSTCDPSDGRCKCGGPGGPACSSNQICNLGPPSRCEGGQQCVNPDGGTKTCGSGTSCDPEDGVCKCGGRGGLSCAPPVTDEDGVVRVPGEICVTNLVQIACRMPCSVLNPDCPEGTYCYFDSSATPVVSYCAAPTGSQEAGQNCTTAAACFDEEPSPHALHCLGLALGVTGLCHTYCDVALGAAGCLQDIPRECQQIPGAPPGTGYCKASN